VGIAKISILHTGTCNVFYAVKIEIFAITAIDRKFDETPW
jgi:hypothetical protein